jgi:hypothetical protein
MNRHRLPAFAFAIAVGLVGAVLFGCNRGGIPATAGNRVIAFALDAHGGNATAAYEQLCAATKSAVPFEAFQQTRGAAVSPVVPSDSWILTRNEKVPSFQTEDPSVTETWTEVKVRWPPEGTAPASTTATTVWRVHLVREDGLWKVCRFEPAPDQSAGR